MRTAILILSINIVILIGVTILGTIYLKELKEEIAFKERLDKMAEENKEERKLFDMKNDIDKIKFYIESTATEKNAAIFKDELEHGYMHLFNPYEQTEEVTFVTSSDGVVEIIVPEKNGNGVMRIRGGKFKS